MIYFLFFISLIPRIIFTPSFPPGLNWDEVSHGYNAYSLIKTGADEWGNFLPAIFRAYGDYKLPLYVYLTAIPVSILGLTPLSVRLVSIIAGSLLAPLIYLFLKKLTSATTALIGSLIIAFSPSLVFLSRVALEANLYLFLFCLSLYFLFLKKFPLSAAIYGLALLTYNSSRVLLFPYLLALLFLVRQNHYSIFKNFPKFTPFLIAILIFVPQSLTSSGQSRYQWVTILDSGAVSRIEELRQTYPRFLVNKVTYFTFTAAKNYLAHFNPQYLFKIGGSHSQFNIPDFYLLSPLLLPFFLLGLPALKKHPLILFFLLVSPLPSAITRDAPQILRSITFIPLTIITISLGINQVTCHPKLSKLIPAYILFTLIFSQINFWQKYSNYRLQYSQSWQYGYQQAVDFVKSNYHQYQKIIFTKKYGEPHEFILFYWPWDPTDYRQKKVWDYHANWYWVNAFDKFVFINDWEIKDQNFTPGTLLVTGPGNFSQNGAKILKTINFLDGQPAFDIISYD